MQPREEWHTNKLTLWPERLGQPDTEFPPKQTWGWAIKEIEDLSSQCRISDRFGKWRLRQDASGTTFPRHWRMWSSDSHFSRRDQGLTGCTLRDSLGLQLRIPATLPKGTYSSLWQWHSSVKPGITSSWSQSFPQHRYYRLWRLGQKSSLPSTSDSVSERQSPLCLWGPWVWSNFSILYAI